MRLGTTAKTLSIVAVFALTLTAVRAAQASDKGCSNATLKGAYSDQDTGTIVGLGPFAGVNVDSFDGHGNMTINGYSSVNGSVSQAEETGTYQVKSDCTGTLQYSVIPAGSNQPLPTQEIDQFVVLEGANELVLMPLQGALGPPIALGSMKRQIWWPGSTVTLAVTGPQDGTAYKVGDEFTLTIAAPGYANQPVSVAQNGAGPA